MLPKIVKIICVGNALHGDDGLGFAVFKQLQSLTLPKGVELIDGATGGLALIPLFKGCERVILVDLIRCDASPGSILEFKDIDVKSVAAIQEDGLSRADHSGDIKSLLQLMSLYLAEQPVIDVIGISGTATDHFQPELSPPVASALPELCQRILALALSSE